MIINFIIKLSCAIVFAECKRFLSRSYILGGMVHNIYIISYITGGVTNEESVIVFYDDGLIVRCSCSLRS